MNQSVGKVEVCPLEPAKLTEPEPSEAGNGEDGRVLVARRVANQRGQLRWRQNVEVAGWPLRLALRLANGL